MTYEVTIAIPVYNAEKYIRKAMDSALAQTFSSIEFLVCDDCGTDKSIIIIRDYQQTHPRGLAIHIVHQPHNMGIGESRNRLVDEACGQYIYFMDADDYIEPDTIEKLYNNAIKYDAQLVYGSFERSENLGGEEKRIQWVYPDMQFKEDGRFAAWVYRKYEGIQSMIWNILIKVDVFRQNGLRFPALNYWEDFVTTIDLPTYVNRVVLLSDITYHYICRKGSLSTNQHSNIVKKDNIAKLVKSIDTLKFNSDRIKQEEYFPLRMQKVMMTCFYIVCSILSQRKKITPSFTGIEMRNMMLSPLTLSEILRFGHARSINLLLYLLGILPPSVSISLIWLMGKFKRLI